MKKFIQILALSVLTATFSNVFAAEQAAATNANAANDQTMVATETTTTSTTTTTTETTDKKVKAISMSTLIQQLQKTGYIVRNVEFNKDDGQFKVEVIDKLGEKQSLDIPANGLTAAQKKGISKVAPIAQSLKKYEKKGSYIKSVQLDNGTWKVAVIDNQGNEQDQTIDSQTGKASS